MSIKHLDILVPYPLLSAPSQRFRIEQHFDELNKKYQVRIFPFWSKNTWNLLYKKGHFFGKSFGFLKGIVERKLYLIKAFSADYIYIHREATPLGPPFIEWFLAKVMRKKIIYDFDDAIWLPNQSDANRGVVKNLKYHSKVSKICKWAYKVCVGNELLAEYARQFNNNVIIIPTTVDTEKVHNPSLHSFDKASPSKHYGEGAQDDVKVIGWTGTHSTLHQLDLIWPVLDKLANTYNFEFHLISDHFPDRLPKYVRQVTWNKEQEMQDLMKFDIGVMPLKESDWERGKCGFKLIQYMALEIPAVATAFGANLEIVENPDQALLIKQNNQEEWKNALIKLIDDPSLRKEMGQNGRHRIIEAYSKQAVQEKVLNLFS